MKLLIKTKGGHEQGLGDIIGSIALAGKAVERGIVTKIILDGEKPAIDLVRDSGFEWDEVKTSTDFFLMLDAFSPDVVLLNQLNSPLELVTEIKKRDILIATVDDTGPAAASADLRFNPEYVIADAYCGHMFIPLRLDYQRENLKERVVSKEVHSILVTLGGSDTYGFTPKVVRALSGLTEEISITIIAGPSFQHNRELDLAIGDSRRKFNVIHNVKDMIPFLRSADLAICSAGLTLFELACLGTPVVVICAEMFEEETAQYMEKNGFGTNLGFGVKVSEHAISQAVQSLISDHERRKSMSVKGKKLIDGAGVDRIIEIIVHSTKQHADCEHPSTISGESKGRNL
jgi:spore coat polysaccharide biosynthesis predicted glycosyltransferase SpsG